MNALSPKVKGQASLTVAAFTKDARTAQMLPALCERLGAREVSVQKGDILDAITRYREGEAPDILIIEISGHHFILDLMGQLAAVCPPSIKVIAIGDADSVALFRSLLDRGVSDYLVLPLPETVLEASLGSLLRGQERLDAAGIGKKIGIMGSAGGVGVSTIVANLAMSLSARAHRRLTCLDMTGTGGLSLLFGRLEEGGLSRLLSREEPLDNLILERSAAKISDRADLISLRDGATIPPNFQKLNDLIHHLSQHRHYVLMDWGSGADPAQEEGFWAADLKYLVVAPHLQSVKRAQGILRQADRHLSGTPSIILNQCRPPSRNQLKASEIEELLGHTIHLCIPFERERFLIAENEGVAAVLKSRKCAALFGELQQEITGKSLPKAGSTPWFRRIRGRHVR